MDRTESCPARFCSFVYFLSSCYLGISAALSYIDYITCSRLLPQSSLSSNLQALWAFGMSVTLTLVWLLFLPLTFAVSSDRLSLANCLGMGILLVLGPNLLAWVVFGTVIGVKLVDWELFGDVVGPVVRAANFMAWCFLYLIAVLFTYGAISATVQWCLSRSEERELERMRDLVAQSLPRETVQSPSASECPICLDTYSAGQAATRLLACNHRFHTDCIRGWLQHRTQCPTCRHSVLP